jgi:hypothetical protein
LLEGAGLNVSDDREHNIFRHRPSEIPSGHPASSHAAAQQGQNGSQATVQPEQNQASIPEGESSSTAPSGGPFTEYKRIHENTDEQLRKLLEDVNVPVSDFLEENITRYQQFLLPSGVASFPATIQQQVQNPPVATGQTTSGPAQPNGRAEEGSSSAATQTSPTVSTFTATSALTLAGQAISIGLPQWAVVNRGQPATGSGSQRPNEDYDPWPPITLNVNVFNFPIAASQVGPVKTSTPKLAPVVAEPSSSIVVAGPSTPKVAITLDRDDASPEPASPAEEEYDTLSAAKIRKKCREKDPPISVPSKEKADGLKGNFFKC